MIIVTIQPGVAKTGNLRDVILSGGEASARDRTAAESVGAVARITDGAGRATASHTASSLHALLRSFEALFALLRMTLVKDKMRPEPNRPVVFTPAFTLAPTAACFLSSN